MEIPIAPSTLRRTREMVIFFVMVALSSTASAVEDTNPEFSPCNDTKIQRHDGFSFGLVFAAKDKLAPSNQPQYSPCDSRLNLAQANAQLAVFRPKVDEISLLTIDDPNFNPFKSDGYYMVAFAGIKYAARSAPIFVGDSSKVVTSFTLVLEFDKGVLNNLFWKSYGCNSCSGNSSICVDQQSCAVPVGNCNGRGGSVNCTVGIQLAFSGTDKNLEVLNSWYEVNKLRSFALSSLFA